MLALLPLAPARPCCPQVLNLTLPFNPLLYWLLRQRGNREWYDQLLNTKSPREQVWIWTAWAGDPGCSGGTLVTSSLAFLQPGPQRLAGLVELADIIYEDLQSCYGVYASLFHG